MYSEVVVKASVVSFRRLLGIVSIIAFGVIFGGLLSMFILAAFIL